MRLILRMGLILLVIGAGCEISAIVSNGGYLPVLPYTIIGGIPQLPPSATLDVRFHGEAPVRYITDSNGFRVADRSAAVTPARKVFVAGDSQVLGYGLDFTDTFAATIAERAFGSAEMAAILGTPAMDPEMLEEAVAAQDASAFGDLPVAVIALNLGNDLDEIFTAGSWYRGIDQPRLQAWLMKHSIAYMSYVQWQYARALDRTLVPGINRIFQTTSPEERVLLARETADLLVRIARSVGARNTCILIIPQDIQVFPKDFGKYADYFGNERDFARWKNRVPEIAENLSLLETYIAARVEKAGFKVIRLSALLPREGDPARYFSRTSHHLEPTAHALIGSQISTWLSGK